MKTVKHPPTPEHATLRLNLDIDRIPGDRLAAIVEEVRRVTNDEVSVSGLVFEPVSFELAGPRPELERLQTMVLQGALRSVQGSWRPIVGGVNRAARPSSSRGRQVLVVDGDSARARASADALDRAQIEACIVGSIETAQVMLQRSTLRFDAVVLQHRLQDGEGLELLERVALPERGGSVLVIDEEPLPERAMAYRLRGAFRYVPGPLGPLQLIGRVNATMADSQAWREAEEPGAQDPNEPPRQLVDPEQAADRLQHICELSATEREVAVMVLMGLRDLDIADKIGQSERTAKRHVGRVLEKAGIENRASLWSVLYEDGQGRGPIARGAEPPVVRSTPPSSASSSPSPSRPATSTPLQPSWTSA